MRRRISLAIVAFLSMQLCCQPNKTEPQTPVIDALLKLDCDIFEMAFMQRPSENSLWLYVELDRDETIETLARQLPTDFKRADGDLAGGEYNTFFESKDLSISVGSEQLCSRITKVSVVR